MEQRRDAFPHFAFDFQKIHAYWMNELASYEEAKRYLDVVGMRLKYWLDDLGPWVEYSLAEKHLGEDLHFENAAAALSFYSLRHRVRLANEQLRKLGAESLLASIVPTDNANRDCIWHEDFRRPYVEALVREKKLLRRLHMTGFLERPTSGACRSFGEDGRARLRWMWANRLLAYLFEALRERGAFCDDEAMWAALDGVFIDRQGKPITRKDLALWAHQYHNNSATGVAKGKPKRHGLVDDVIDQIQGE